MTKLFKTVFSFCMFLLLIFWFSVPVLSQRISTDSLKSILNKPGISDSLRVEICNKLCWELKNTDPKLAESYCLKGIETAKKIRFRGGEASAFNNLGVIVANNGDRAKAAEYFINTLRIREKIAEENGFTDSDKRALAYSLNNLGNIYRMENKYELAIDYMNRSLKYKQETGDKKGMGQTYVNISNLYRQQNNDKQSLIYSFKGLEIFNELNNAEGRSLCYHNIGYSYDNLGNTDSSLIYYLKAAEIKEKLNDKLSLSNTLGNIGGLYASMKEFDQAILYYNKAIEIQEVLDAKYFLKNSYKGMANAQSGAGNFELAYQYLLKNAVLIDSLYSEESAKSIAEMSTKYETEKKEKEILLLQKEKKLTQLEQLQKSEEIKLLNKEKELQSFTIENKYKEVQLLKRENELKAVNLEKKNREVMIAKQSEELKEAELAKEKNIRYFVLSGLALVLVFSFALVNRFRITRKQKRIIELQKAVVEERNKDITDSINYALRIQQSLLPGDEEMNKSLGEHFIFYKPKDIVSGDFYWMNSIRTTRGDEESVRLVVLAVGDCTGHGVPGAMMTMIANTLLNQTIKNKDINSPAEALDFVNRELPKNLKRQSNSISIKDGMDVVMLAIDRQNKKMYFSGANNSAYIVRKGQLTDIKGDSHSVTASDEWEKSNFTLQTLDLEPGDSIYLSTDGYPDQFGGSDKEARKGGGKKFKTTRLKELLVSVCDKPMEEQKETIRKVFEEWKGNLEQIDDVCIIGVRL